MMSRRDETIASVAAGPSRRRFVQLSAAGLAVTLGRSLCSDAEVQDKGPRGLKRGDKVEIGGRGKEIIQRAYELGYEYEKRNGG